MVAVVATRLCALAVLVVLASVATVSSSDAPLYSVCAVTDNPMCASIMPNSDILFYPMNSTDVSGSKYYQMKMSLARIQMGSVYRPLITQWIQCAIASNSTGWLFNETRIKCKALVRTNSTVCIVLFDTYAALNCRRRTQF